jgi:hypothetical protein
LLTILTTWAIIALGSPPLLFAPTRSFHSEYQ